MVASTNIAYCYISESHAASTRDNLFFESLRLPISHYVLADVSAHVLLQYACTGIVRAWWIQLCRAEKDHFAKNIYND